MGKQGQDGTRFFQTDIPLELSVGFSKKRIDHRHHAMDAIVIACTGRNIVNYLNNIAASSDRDKERHDSLHKATVSGLVRLQQRKEVKLSSALEQWQNIADKELRQEIAKLIQMYHKFDQKLFAKYFKDRGNKLNGRDISKVPIYYYTEKENGMAATRVAIDDTFDTKKIAPISDSGIRKIMLAHLKQYDDENGKSHPEMAFSPEGIESMNQNIKELNGGKGHKPIYKVRKTETLGMKFSVGEVGHKNRKYVEADKGTNLFFAIYVNEEGERSFESIPLNIAIERLKNHLNVAEESKEDGRKLLFTLSPNDLVYLPDAGDGNHIYKMVSCTGNEAYFIPNNIANVIRNGYEFGSLNKIQTMDGTAIRKVCEKIEVDRLGRITRIYK